jgi:hypothetical protein
MLSSAADCCITARAAVRVLTSPAHRKRCTCHTAPRAARREQLAQRSRAVPTGVRLLAASPSPSRRGCRAPTPPRRTSPRSPGHIRCSRRGCGRLPPLPQRFATPRAQAVHCAANIAEGRIGALDGAGPADGVHAARVSLMRSERTWSSSPNVSSLAMSADEPNAPISDPISSCRRMGSTGRRGMAVRRHRRTLRWERQSTAARIRPRRNRSMS